ncbi:Type I phosphodiesterase/nucleotide pyrophosphatase [Mesobacillus thioparans]
MKTAALLWPVTAKAAIDYNMPEIFANRPWHHQIPISLFNGSPRYQLEMNSKFGHIRNGLSQPALDDFVLASTEETIKTKKPELMLIHFVDLDSQRHMHGFSSKEAQDALHRHDHRLGKILEATKEAGIYENTTFVLLGDHSALDESKVVKLNVLFKERGLIKVNGAGKVNDWKAYCKSCDGSAYVYVSDENDIETKNTVTELLAQLLQERSNGIEKVITGQEANTMGADGSAFRMLEAARGFYFSEAIDGEYIEEVSEQDAISKRYTLACHGYSPEKDGYHTVFFAAGKGIRTGISVRSMHLVDEGPTFARLLGLDLGDTDGRVLEGILDI